MGRPIKKTFFGNLNDPYDGSVALGSGVGGEGVASVTLSTTSFAVSTLTITMSFTAPQIAGGVTATGTPVKTGNTVTSVLITEAGSGYTSAPTVAFTGTNMTTQGAGTAVLTASRENALYIVSYLPNAGQSRTNGDIIKQESSRRYLVQNTDGQGVCKLVGAVPAAGEMNIIATDLGGATYYVTKLTGRKATLTNRSDTSTAYYASGEVAPWTIGAASGTEAPTAIVTLTSQ